MRKWTPIPNHPNVYSYETKHGTIFGVRRGFENSLGKRDEFTKSGLTTWRAAEAELKKFEATLVTDQINPITNRGVTVNQYFSMMVKRNIQLKVWRMSTVKSKRDYYNKHIKPKFGNQLLSSIKRKAYQDFIDTKIVERHYAQSTMQTMDSVMQVIMNDAEKNNIIDKNRLRDILVNGAKPAKSVDLTPEDYTKFMETAETMLDKYELTMIYLLTLGERREELCGLQFKSFERGTQDDMDYYKITYYSGRTQYEPDGGDLKSNAAYRYNYVTDAVVKMIVFTLQYVKNIFKRTHHVVEPDSYVYINPKNGCLRHPSNVNRTFNAVKEKAGVEMRPHMLRHYFATQALQDGQPDMTVMHWIGHKHMEMTQAYTRPTEEGALQLITGIQEETLRPTQRR